MKQISAFTDGACSGNPGPGGWGAILRYGENEKELSGGTEDTTNNRMELTAVIRALEALKAPCSVTVYTDSGYVVDGFTKWMRGWADRGWRTASGGQVKNVDLWTLLERVSGQHSVKMVWVKGHAGHPENERADRLAVAAMQPYRRKK